MRNISIAYSPDTDDAFMVEALRTGRVDSSGFEFTFVSADIQELNEKARNGFYDITAISIAAYPELEGEYGLMPVGASIGDRFGPALIVRRDSPLKHWQELSGKKMAVPGLATSAYFAARGLIGAFEPRPMHFMKIAGSVLTGEVDAGVLIHELQLNCDGPDLRKLSDLGSLWHERFHLPLPLGANVIRRSLGAQAIAQLTTLLRESIELGLATRQETLASALRQSKAAIDQSLGDRYISMYVNERSLRFEEDVKEGMKRLFEIGIEQRLCRNFDVSQAFSSL